MTLRYRWLPLCLALLGWTAYGAAAQPTATPSSSDLRTQLARLTSFQQDEVVWLARCLYSESDRAHEQRLVAWVVRNRVETQYRGRTYREVILEPRQFSAFNEPSLRRNHIMGLNPHSLSKGWRQALTIALDVYRAPAKERPFDVTTRHFYSPVSMEGGRTPHWAQGVPALSSTRLGIDPNRFRFFAGIDEGSEGPEQPIPVQTVSETPTRAAVEHATSSSSRRSSIRSRLRSRQFSGRVKRPLRPYLKGRSGQ